MQSKEFSDGSGLEWEDYGRRMYDVQIGRWMVNDVHSEKYVFLSPYVYVANRPTIAIDPDGKDIIILNAPKHIGGMGHAAVLIGNEKSGWVLYSKNGTTLKSSGPSNKEIQQGVRFRHLADFAKQNFEEGSSEIKYTRAFLIKSEKDEEMKVAADKSTKSWYTFIGNFFGGGSCIDVCSDALKAGGFDPRFGPEATVEDPLTGGSMTFSGELSPIPNDRYNQIVINNVGTDIIISILPPKDVQEKRKKQMEREKNRQKQEKTLHEQREFRNSILF